MPDLFRTLIIQAQDAPISRAIAQGFGPGGQGMWTTPLSADGQEPATHYISSGYIPAEFVSLSPFTRWTMDENGNWTQADHYPGDAATVFAYASGSGLPITLQNIEGIFARSDVSDQEPFTAMSRMGLQIINPPME